MKIEVGKWKTRGGQMATVLKHKGGGWQGTLGGHSISWYSNGDYLGAPQTVHDFDLIAPWEDTPAPEVATVSDAVVEKLLREHCIPAQPKQESMMDVKEGDRVLVEATVIFCPPSGTAVVRLSTGDTANVKSDAIKSVQPAPPEVGDRCEWSGGPPRVLVAHGDDWCLWRSQAGGLEPYTIPLSKMQEVQSFRVIKRREKK